MKIFNRLSRINILNPLARLHVENQHADARQAYRTFLRLRNAPGIGVQTEARIALGKAQELGLDEDDIAILREELSVPIAFR